MIKLTDSGSLYYGNDYCPLLCNQTRNVFCPNGIYKCNFLPYKDDYFPSMTDLATVYLDLDYISDCQRLTKIGNKLL